MSYIKAAWVTSHYVFIQIKFIRQIIFSLNLRKWEVRAYCYSSDLSSSSLFLFIFTFETMKPWHLLRLLGGASAHVKASVYTEQHNIESRGHAFIPRTGFKSETALSSFLVTKCMDPVTGLFRPHDCIRLVVYLMVLQVFWSRSWANKLPVSASRLYPSRSFFNGPPGLLLLLLLLLITELGQ